MLFLLKFVCCIGGAALLAGITTAIEVWNDKHPVVEEKSVPLYIRSNWMATLGIMLFCLMALVLLALFVAPILLIAYITVYMFKDDDWWINANAII